MSKTEIGRKIEIEVEIEGCSGFAAIHKMKPFLR